MIFFLFSCKEYKGHNQCHHFGGNNRNPNAVNVPDQGENQDSGYLKQECSEKRNQCGCQTVIEGGKKSGAEYGNSGEEKRKGVEKEGTDRHIQ